MYFLLLFLLVGQDCYRQHVINKILYLLLSFYTLLNSNKSVALKRLSKLMLKSKKKFKKLTSLSLSWNISDYQKATQIYIKVLLEEMNNTCS